MTYLKKLFTLPVFEDETEARQAYLLHIIVWMLICIPIPFVIYTVTLTHQNVFRTLMQAVFGEGINIILLFMLHRKYVRAASILQVSAFWFFFTATAITGAGVKSEAYLLGYGVIITIAGILLGGTGSAIFAFLSLSTGAFMVYAQAQEILVPGIVEIPLTTWMISFVLFPVGAVLQYLASRTERNALDRARASEEKYRLISQVSSDYTFATEVHKDGTASLSWVAGAFEKMTGYTYEEYVATGSWLAHVHPDDLERDEQDMEKLYKNQDIKSEIRTFTKNGEIRWERIFAHPVWDEQENRLIGIIGAIQDVTEHKQAEEALRESEAIYRQAIEVAGAVPYHQSYLDNGNVTYDFIGEGIRQITGYGPEEFDEKLWDSLVQERLLLEDLAGFSLTEAIDKVRSGINPVWKCEHCIKARDGKIRWVLEAAVDLRDEHGVAHGSVGLYQDITERKQSEDALRYERDLLQIFMDNIPDFVYFKDAESRFVRINQAQGHFLGVHDPQDAIGKTDLDFQNPELARGFMAEEKHVMETGQPVLNRIESNPTDSGEPRWLLATKVPVKDKLGHVIGVIGISRDVTEQRESQEKLQKISLQQAAILNNIPDMAWLKDKDSRYIAVNEQFAKTAGIKMEEVAGKTDFDIWREDFAEKYRKDDVEVLRSRQLKNTEEILVNSTGNEYWVETTKTPILNSNGEVIGTTGIARDITERKKAQESEQYRRIMLEKVVQLGKLVTEASNLRSTIKKIWHGVHDDLGFDRLAIFLFNPEFNTMDDTVGTNNAGEMVEQWDISSPIDSTFGNLLKKPDGLYFTHNYDEENEIPEGHEMYGIKDYVAVAAWAGDKPVAVICADHGITRRPIGAEQLEALRLFGGYAGLAIENARLNEKIQNELSQQILAKEREEHRRAMLEKVVQLGQLVTEVSDLRTTLARIWHGVHDDLGFDRLGIYLYNPQRKSMDGTFGTNHQGEMIDEWHTSISMEQDNPEAKSFLRVLENPDTTYLTHSYKDDHNTPEGNIMAGVKDFAAIAAWAGEKPVAVICVDHVITGRPITEEQLEALRLFASYAGLAIENARLNSALENELAQRKKFIVELEAKNAELERFTYTVSHDLKSPLVTIKGFLGYLEKDAYAGNFEKFKKDVYRIETAVEKMQNLLKDLLELSRVGRLMNTPVEIPFNEIVKDALEIVDGQIKAAKVFVDYKISNIMVKCDRIRLTEVMQNLIDNAIKFMGTQSSPRIEVGHFINDKHENVFYVKDNGAGIAPEFHGKIFGLFDKLTADSDGTGIGLALVKRIIEVHGGRIWVESQVGLGAVFYFTLP